MKLSTCLWAALIAGPALLHSPLRAETLTFAAVRDFPQLDAGEVPYYADLGDDRDVLAIDAARENYRSKFARATLTFDGTPGIYNVTLTTLGELDGDCIYQFLVNGVVQGTVINDPVTNDYEEQLHRFDSISIPSGAVLGVASVALSNDKIPEGDGFAFARGRWRSLTLDSVEASGAAADFVDLELSIATTKNILQVGDSANLSVTTRNLETSTTATSPIISANLPDSLSFTSSADCELADQDVQCQLPELQAGSMSTVAFSVTATASGKVTLAAEVDADQTDLNILNNVSAASIVVAGDEPGIGAAKSAGGSGAISPWWWLVLLPSLWYRRRP